ncbi:MAG TPA: hypothetical protein VE093_08615 [Polyangiaceae bacterium]|jgi:hypothetical protein|nr:hypothetical protein [Polyangiaceae bacterium]
MRVFGPKAPLFRFRWDLVYLLAGLLADRRAEIKDLASAIEALLVYLRKERDALESAEDLVMVTIAKKNRRDEDIDNRLVMLGGVSRAVHKDLYERLFPGRAPSALTRLGLNKQMIENDRILGELAALPAIHPMRVEYEAVLTADMNELRALIKASNEAEVSLKLARSHMRQFKAKMDSARVETHGKLQALLASRKEADTFFRALMTAPGETEDGVDEACDEAPTVTPGMVPSTAGAPATA